MLAAFQAKLSRVNRFVLAMNEGPITAEVGEREGGRVWVTLSERAPGLLEWLHNVESAASYSTAVERAVG
jgi:hypothetical protein